MDGGGVSTESLGVIITFATGLAKLTQAGLGDRIQRAGAMGLALGYSLVGVALWAISQPAEISRLWIFGLAQATVISALSTIGVFSAVTFFLAPAGEPRHDLPAEPATVTGVMPVTDPDPLPLGTVGGNGPPPRTGVVTNGPRSF